MRLQTNRNLQKVTKEKEFLGFQKNDKQGIYCDKTEGMYHEARTVNK